MKKCQKVMFNLWIYFNSILYIKYSLLTKSTIPSKLSLKMRNNHSNVMRRYLWYHAFPNRNLNLDKRNRFQSNDCSNTQVSKIPCQNSNFQIQLHIYFIIQVQACLVNIYYQQHSNILTNFTFSTKLKKHKLPYQSP